MSDAAAPAKSTGGGNKMMFIMMGVMFITLLGGMGGMFMMLNKSSAKEGGTAAHAEEKKGEEHDESAVKAAAIYVSFEPPFVVNFPAGGDVKFLQLTVQGMTRNEIMEKAMQRNSPAIRDALLTLFGQQTADVLATAEGKEQLRVQSLEALRNVMKAEGEKPEEIEAVYFTTFVMQ